MKIYQLAFYAHSGGLQTVIDLSPTSQLRYSSVLNNFGAIEFTLPLRDSHPCMTTLDTVCVVYVSDGSGPMVEDGAYFLRYQNPMDVEGEDILVVAGYGVEYLLWNNIFIAEDDPLEANGFSTKSGAADTIMREIVVEQCVDPEINVTRAIPNLTVPAVPGTGDFVAFREEDSDTKVIEFLKKLARAGGVDFWMDYDPSTPTFTLHFGTRGTDKRKSTHYPTSPYLYFSPNIGNIDLPRLEVDRREEANVVHVFGQGPGGTNLRYLEAGPGSLDSPWNRKEFGVHARNTKTLDDWLTEAANALTAERQKLTSFSFQPKLDSPGAEYREDWVVGDLVTAAYQDQEFEMRITEAVTTVTETMATTEPEMVLL